MNFEYNTDQQAFKDSVSKFLQQEYDFEARQKVVNSSAAYNESLWKTCAELGWLSLPFSEDVGGFGGSAVDTILLFEELGKSLVIEPFMESLVLFGGVLNRTEHARKNEYIERLMIGELQGAMAHLEAHSRGKHSSILATAELKADSYKINGSKALVYNAANAEFYIVSARVENAGKQELALLLVPAEAEGISLNGYTTVDGRQAAEVSLSNVSVTKENLLATGKKALTILEQTFDEALLAQVAEMIGAMDTLVFTTVEYAKERKQFGLPLSKFQGLQHKMVEMFMAAELARSLMYAAAIKLRDGSDDARAYVAAAKVKADKCAKIAAHHAVQVHGGIGTTDELKVGHYLKHIEVLTKQFGHTSTHLQRFKSLQC